MTEDPTKNDVVIEVKLPLKEYLIMREMIEERQAMNGLRKWLTNRVFWLAGGVMALIGVFEAFRRLGE